MTNDKLRNKTPDDFIAPNVGTRSKYETHIKPKFKQIEAWCRDGYLEKDIAKMLGVAESTFKAHKKKHADFRTLLMKSRELVDIEVENKLYTRAMGYTYDEVTYEYGEEVKRVTKTVQPDTTAQIFWLKNRIPAKWRDKRNYEHQGEITTNVNNVSELTSEQLKAIVDKLGDDEDGD